MYTGKEKGGLEYLCAEEDDLSHFVEDDILFSLS